MGLLHPALPGRSDVVVELEGEELAALSIIGLVHRAPKDWVARSPCWSHCKQV